MKIEFKGYSLIISLYTCIICKDNRQETDEIIFHQFLKAFCVTYHTNDMQQNVLALSLAS